MKGQEEYQLYAINVDVPYILEEQELETFFQNSEKQAKFMQKIYALFGKELFSFSADDDGMEVVAIDEDYQV